MLHAQKTREPLSEQIEREDEVVRVHFRRRPYPSIRRAIPELPFRPDIVHGHFYDAAGPTLLLARRLGVPFVLTEHSVLARPLTPLERLAFREAQRVMPVSQMLRKSLESSGVEARYEVVPNVVDLASFSPAPHSHGPIKRLVAVTRMTEIKGVPDLLQALHLLQSRRQDWTCELIGGGERGDDYRALASQLGLGNVVFRGELRRPEVAAALREADLFVLASRTETFSVATVEAMASGLPAVVTACGGPEELVRPETGVIVPKQDPAALAEALDRTLSDLGRFRPKEIAKGVAGRFGAEVVGRRLLEVYEEAKKAAGATTGWGPRLSTTNL